MKLSLPSVLALAASTHALTESQLCGTSFDCGIYCQAGSFHVQMNRSPYFYPDDGLRPNNANNLQTACGYAAGMACQGRHRYCIVTSENTGEVEEMSKQLVGSGPTAAAQDVSWSAANAFCKA